MISLLDINKEGKIIKKIIESLKEDIENIKDENIKIANKIIQLEESAFKESLCEEENEAIKNGGSKSPLFKCKKCQFRCEKEITIRKHVNTKHSDKEINYETSKSNTIPDDSSQSEKSNETEIEHIEEDDFFLLECEALVNM